LIIAIGGGITTDIAAYAASTFKRGCRLWLVPSTLLGMIDAAIGGKTAVNFHKIKNCLGSFYPAQKIIIDLEFLKTLDAEALLSGWAEIIKIYLISGLESELIDNAEPDLRNVIARSIQQKIKICQKDLYEENQRKLLNLGHTFGHVIESISEYKISHGRAVALGLRLAARLSFQKGIISDQRYAEINCLLDKYSFPQYKQDYLPQTSAKDLEIILAQDKKFGNRPLLVLFSEKGTYLDHDCSISEICKQFFLD
jgi:3-dehydroquinate synthase